MKKPQPHPLSGPAGTLNFEQYVGKPRVKLTLPQPVVKTAEDWLALPRPKIREILENPASTLAQKRTAVNKKIGFFKHAVRYARRGDDDLVLFLARVQLKAWRSYARKHGL